MCNCRMNELKSLIMKVYLSIIVNKPKIAKTSGLIIS